MTLRYEFRPHDQIKQLPGSAIRGKPLMAEILSPTLKKFISRQFPACVIEERFWLELLTAGAMDLITADRFSQDMSSKNRLMLSLGDLTLKIKRTIVRVSLAPSGRVTITLNIPRDLVQPFLHLMSPRLGMIYRGNPEITIGHDPYPKPKTTYVVLDDLCLELSMRRWLERSRDQLKVEVMGSDKVQRPVSTWKLERMVATQVNKETDEFQMTKM